MVQIRSNLDLLSAGNAAMKKQIRLPIFRIFKRIIRSQLLLYLLHILVSPGDQEVARSIVRADGLGNAFWFLATAVHIDRKTEIFSER